MDGPGRTLEECEARIEGYFDLGWKVGEGLRKLREELADEDEFIKLCNDRPGMKGAKALMYVWAVDVRDNLNAAGCDPLPRYMHQVRPLIGLEPSEQITVWLEALR